MLPILKIHKGLNQPFSCGTTCQGLTNFFALGIVGLPPGKSLGCLP